MDLKTAVITAKWEFAHTSSKRDRRYWVDRASLALNADLAAQQARDEDHSVDGNEQPDDRDGRARQ